MTLINFAVIVIVCYFMVTGVNFIFRPESVSLYDVAATSSTGKTEIRCYYGALAIGLACFVAYLGFHDLGRQAVAGVSFIATAIFVTRVIGTVIDGGWKSSYTKLAVPVEAGFVIALGVVLLLT